MQIKLTYYKANALIPVIAIAWAVSSWGLSKLWGYGLLQGVGPTLIVGGLLFLYDKVLWKLPAFRLMNSAPNLNGEYKGKIYFHWKGADGEKSCRLTVKQTCSHIKVKSSFGNDIKDSTQSSSTEAFIKTDEAGDQSLYFYYHNPGTCKHGDTLDPHDGMTVLEILHQENRIKLKGYYFTNRSPEQTKGCMEATQDIEEGNR